MESVLRVGSLSSYYRNVRSVCSLELAHPSNVSRNLGRKGIRGLLPPGLDQLSNLRVANFDNNYLWGTIPVFPPSLEALDLSYNRFSGTLPAFDNLANFRILYVDLQFFSGCMY